MTEIKNKFDELNQGELKDVKGGIPYEPPDLVELTGISLDCGVGIYCSSGNGDSCTDSKTCSRGSAKSRDPEPL